MALTVGPPSFSSWRSLFFLWTLSFPFSIFSFLASLFSVFSFSIALLCSEIYLLCFPSNLWWVTRVIIWWVLFGYRPQASEVFWVFLVFHTLLNHVWCSLLFYKASISTSVLVIFLMKGLTSISQTDNRAPLLKIPGSLSPPIAKN